MDNTFIGVTSLVFLLGLPCLAGGEQSLLEKVAIHYVGTEYGRISQGMHLKGHEEKKAVVVTLSGKTSQGVLSYLVIPDTFVPTTAGKPEPERKWYGATTLKVAGPQIGGWPSSRTPKLSLAEYQLLSGVTSIKDVTVEDERIREIVRSKILPEQMQRPWKGEEWSDAHMTMRATTIQVHSFDFKTKVGMGGNLMGVSVYIDSNGLILSLEEDMLHVD